MRDGFPITAGIGHNDRPPGGECQVPGSGGVAVVASRAADIRRPKPRGRVKKILGGNFLRIFREVCG